MGVYYKKEIFRDMGVYYNREFSGIWECIIIGNFQGYGSVL